MPELYLWAFSLAALMGFLKQNTEILELERPAYKTQLCHSLVWLRIITSPWVSFFLTQNAENNTHVRVQRQTMRTFRLSRHCRHAVHLSLWVSEDYLSSHMWSKCGCHPLPTTGVSKSGPKASSGAPPALVEICWLRVRATFLVLLQLLTELSRGGYGLQSSKYLLTGPLLQALRNVVSTEIMLSCMNVLIYKVRPIISILEMRKLRIKVAKQGHTVEVEIKPVSDS